MILTPRQPYNASRFQWKPNIPHVMHDAWEGKNSDAVDRKIRRDRPNMARRYNVHSMFAKLVLQFFSEDNYVKMMNAEMNDDTLLTLDVPCDLLQIGMNKKHCWVFYRHAGPPRFPRCVRGRIPSHLSSTESLKSIPRVQRSVIKFILHRSEGRYITPHIVTTCIDYP